MLLHRHEQNDKQEKENVVILMNIGNIYQIILNLSKKDVNHVKREE
jgi:hypothetical protein